MTEMTVPSGGTLLAPSNGPFRLLLAYLERCSGVRKGSELSLEDGLGMKPLVQSDGVLLQNKCSCTWVYPTLEGFPSQI